MPARDLELLIQAARRAGEVASSFVGGALNVREKPDDQGPVTAADLAVNAMLERVLKDARPNYGWLSEESVHDPRRLKAERVFIIDPIDGTRSFIEGANTWAHSLAVAEHGKVIAGVVFLPMRDRIYTAALGHGAFCNGNPITPSARQEATGAEILLNKIALDPTQWKGSLPDIKRAFRPSLAYRQSLVAEGRFDAMLSFRDIWEWDVAAGTIILSEAGGVVSNITGGPMRFNNPVPNNAGVLAAGPALHHALLSHITGMPPASS